VRDDREGAPAGDLAWQRVGGVHGSAGSVAARRGGRGSRLHGRLADVRGKVVVGRDGRAVFTVTGEIAARRIGRPRARRGGLRSAGRAPPVRVDWTLPRPSGILAA
jgi:hypothetical protein